MKKSILAAMSVFIILFSCFICASAADNVIVFKSSTTLPRTISGVYYYQEIYLEGGNPENYQFSFPQPRTVPSYLEVSKGSRENEETGEMEYFGILSGVIEASDLNYPFIVSVTDGVNTTNEIFTLPVENQPVHYLVSNNIGPYDRQDHTAVLVPYLTSGEDLSYRLDGEGNRIYQVPDADGNLMDLSSTVTYGGTVSEGGTSSKSNVGTYSINVNVSTAGYKTGRLSSNVLQITQNKNVEMSMEDQTVTYDGNPKIPVARVVGYPYRYPQGVNPWIPQTDSSVGTNSVGSLTLFDDGDESSGEGDDPADTEDPSGNEDDPVNTEEPSEDEEDTSDPDKSYDLAYTLTYKPATNGDSYAPPVEPGEYTVYCTLADSNYDSPEARIEATLNIEPRKVTFNYKDDNTEVPYGGHPNIENDADLVEGEDYTLSFKNSIGRTFTDSTKLDQGWYSVTVVFEHPEYFEAANELSSIHVVPCPVTFTVHNDVLQYDNGNTVTPTPVDSDPELPDDAYTVIYENEDGTVFTSLSQVGRYRVIRVILNGSYADNYEYSSDRLIQDGYPITILAKLVFKANDMYEDPHLVYNTNGQTPNITCSKDGFRQGTHYIVTYSAPDPDNPGSYKTIASPTNAGEYKIDIELTDAAGAYEIGQQPTKFTIEKRPIDFSISNDRYVYNEGTSRNPVIKVTTGNLGTFNAGTAYTVSYLLDNKQPEDGIQQVGSYDIDISFSDDNNTVGKIVKEGTTTSVSQVVVYPKEKVNFDLDKNSSVYRDEIPKVTCTSHNSFENGTQYTVAYKKKNSEGVYEDMSGTPSAVGEYQAVVSLVDWEDKGIDFEYEQGTPSGGILPFEITKKNVRFKVTNTSPTYTGRTLTPGVSCENVAGFALNVDYRISYVPEGSETPEAAPTDVGKYNVVITLTDSENYSKTQTADYYEIVPKPVKFKISDLSRAYTGDKLEPTIESLENKFTGYSYSYTKGSSEDPVDPVAVGEYNINLSITNSNYELGSIVDDQGNELTSPVVFTIVGKDIKFNIENNKLQYTGKALAPTISTEEEGISDDSYNVVFKDADDNAVTEMKELGKYTIEISLKDAVKANYTIADYDNTFVIYGVKFGTGNSVYGLIEASFSSDEDKTKAKADFAVSRLYKNAIYSVYAWGDETDSNTVDLDTDPTALILYNRQKNTIPAAIQAVDSNGDAVSKIDITFMGEDIISGDDEEASIEKVESVKISNGVYEPVQVAPGVYNIAYSFTDPNKTTVTQNRKAAVLWELGDVNKDFNVNNPDANALRRLLNDDNFKAEKTVFKYRICDVDRNGVVDNNDYQAIRKRMNTPIGEFYGE